MHVCVWVGVFGCIAVLDPRMAQSTSEEMHAAKKSAFLRLHEQVAYALHYFDLCLLACVCVCVCVCVCDCVCVIVQHVGVLKVLTVPLPPVHTRGPRSLSRNMAVSILPEASSNSLSHG